MFVPTVHMVLNEVFVSMEKKMCKRVTPTNTTLYALLSGNLRSEAVEHGEAKTSKKKTFNTTNTQNITNHATKSLH